MALTGKAYVEAWKRDHHATMDEVECQIEDGSWKRFYRATCKCGEQSDWSWSSTGTDAWVGSHNDPYENPRSPAYD